ncbi:IS4 family transposase [Nostoc sp. UHCC 0302]|uniref:IS4 family transposase n=1 Tax=Nostoc sp. UHCC 0302 TaxID=3134896 RepID=UPI00311C9396
MWSRKEEELGKTQHRKQKSTAQKESIRWLDALKLTESIIPESVQVVTIADRGDITGNFGHRSRPSTEIEPICWLLLTTLEISSLEDVLQYVRWYSYRWLIERYHYVLKSGCGIKKLQLETAHRIEMALATYSIVAWRLLWLTYLARCQPDASCEQVLAPHEWQVLYATIHHQLYPHTVPPTLAQIVDWIARLGGFLAYLPRGATALGGFPDL